VHPPAQPRALANITLMLLSDTPSDPQGQHLDRIVRMVCFCYVLLLGCPIRYWPIDHSKDSSWLLACNFAAAHGLIFGRDIDWTTGPLGYLTFPQDIGTNLLQGLLFQIALWLVFAFIFRELFFRAQIPARKLIIFTFFWALSTPLFWFNRTGVEYLIFSCVLILLFLVRFNGGRLRFFVALLLVGLIPLIKLTAGVSVAGALAGFLLDQTIRLRWRSWSYILAALCVPAALTGLCFFLTIHSLSAVQQFLRASAEISAGYSEAMSMARRWVDIFGAFEVLLLLLIAMACMLTLKNMRFFALLLIVPVFVAFKHGFVRQDGHIAIYFAFIALAMGLVSLANENRVSLRKIAVLIFLPFVILWQDYTLAIFTIEESTGIRDLQMLAGGIPFGLTSIKRKLHNQAEADPELSKLSLDKKLRDAIGDSSVAYLSPDFSAAIRDGVNLKIYPIVQQYQANTPNLDQLNATWVEREGPTYLVFDGITVDDRQAWAQTPAMWLQIYKWYDTYLYTTKNLLLVRRSMPRFKSIRQIQSALQPVGEGITFPAGNSEPLWTINCPLTTKGKLVRTLFRIPDVSMNIYTSPDDALPKRVIMPMLTSPSLGPNLPTTLEQFADVFSGEFPRQPNVRLTFDGDGLKFYEPACTVAFWSLEF
jgi:hypothetical protein